ncbi:hypothetical protein E5358_06660 [Palleniella muris]|uniref:Uncharacterized protein n=1 Tax=Palleniella muris TaxID=3038145 RepID=A0AC61QQD4_9BACT|nr:SEL1-like repeat protein [Palleniella muris]TGX82447.1 hypothetical protein E5358_06660 [Palleniella muris]
MGGLSEQLNIIKKFIKCHAGESDEVQARRAVETVMPVAESGDAKVQYLLGKYYSWGYHHDCDNLKAIYWFGKAADSGDERAAEAIMDIYRNDCPDGTDVVQRKALILKWHKRWFGILAEKAGKGAADAAQALMNLYVDDCPEDMNPEEGVEEACKWYARQIGILTSKAANGDAVDKMSLADILLYGYNVPEEVLASFTDEDDKRSLLQAVKLYKEVVKCDCIDFLKSEACYNMGRAYDDLGEGKKALASFKKAAKLNNHEAYVKVGDAYHYGNGTEQDDAQARKWYRKGADLGEITAALRLADCYKNGIGGKQDYAKAMEIYMCLAERTGRKWQHQAAGIDTALYELGCMHMEGLGVQQDMKKAYRYFKLAVKKENINAGNALNDERFKDFK